jgi:Cu(I)/Ag(I) efflux system membrane fusion protein
VHVPREAVIRGGNIDRVVVALGEGRFRSRPVTLGIESGDRVAIRSGLEAGEEIVVSGQFLIDSESNIEAALARMDAADTEEQQDHGEMNHEGMDHESMDHGEMDHESMDHSQMDHSRMEHPQ